MVHQWIDQKLATISMDFYLTCASCGTHALFEASRQAEGQKATEAFRNKNLPLETPYFVFKLYYFTDVKILKVWFQKISLPTPWMVIENSEGVGAGDLKGQDFLRKQESLFGILTGHSDPPHPLVSQMLA